jgi:translation initiation factor 1
MKGSKKNSPEAPKAAEQKPFNNPFASLKEQLGPLPEAKPAAPQSAAPKKPKGPARAVVRVEWKGRNGKEVTLVEQLGLSDKELGEWAKALKAGLGCGGSVEEGGVILLQGDQRERIEALLIKRGVQKVSIQA